MKQRKVSRKQISQFFNGENENRCFIAKQWLVKQVLLEQHYQYDDFYFIDICNEQACPDDKFGICRSVFVSEMIHFVCRQGQGVKPFFAFWRQAPDWQDLLSEILRDPIVEDNQKLVRIILQEFCSSQVDENLLRRIINLLIDHGNIWQQDDEIIKVLQKLLQNFIENGGKLKRKELLPKDAFFNCPGLEAYDFEYLALNSAIFPEGEGSAAADIHNICRLARLLKKEQHVLRLFRNIISPYNADEICRGMMTFGPDFAPEVLEVAALQPPVSLDVAIKFLKQLRSIDNSEIAPEMIAKIVDKIAEQAAYVSETLIVEIAKTNFGSVKYLDFSSETQDVFSPNFVSLYCLLNSQDAEIAKKIIARRRLQKKVARYKEKECEADLLAEQIFNNNVVCD